MPKGNLNPQKEMKYTGNDKYEDKYKGIYKYIFSIILIPLKNVGLHLKNHNTVLLSL